MSHEKVAKLLKDGTGETLVEVNRAERGPAPGPTY
jgi:hypothetical protein